SSHSSFKYGTHDWIAEHALDWLPNDAKSWITANLNWYLYGTELPDNNQAPDGIGDTSLHHIYYSISGTLIDDSSARRANSTFNQALSYLLSGDLVLAAKYAGIMTHYIADMAVFGHVMGSGTDWGSEKHHSDYEDYVNTKTSSYNSEFNVFLNFDGDFRIITAYRAATELAYDTTFDVKGRSLTCVWMDQNYDWNNPTFRNRVGESINLAVNYITDVLYTLYVTYINLKQPSSVTVNFSASGLGSDAKGVILIVDGNSYGQLPLSFTWEVGSTHTFTWNNYVSAGSDKRYAWVSTSGLFTSRSGTITVPANGGSITATYKVQYQWTFSANGLSSDATGTIVTIDSTQYGYSSLPIIFWWDKDTSHNYAYQEFISTSISGRRYANHNSPSESITVTSSGSINPSYHVEYKLSIIVNPSEAGITNPTIGDHWYDSGSSVSISATPNMGYSFNKWQLDGLDYSTNNPISITMNSTHTLTAVFEMAWYKQPWIIASILAIIIAIVGIIALFRRHGT
ncbi:MAG: zinc dependent phospholipase C family protein, partial [Candidatus Methanomethylicia archaeon]